MRFAHKQKVHKLHVSHRTLVCWCLNSDFAWHVWMACATNQWLCIISRNLMICWLIDFVLTFSFWFLCHFSLLWVAFQDLFFWFSEKTGWMVKLKSSVPNKKPMSMWHGNHRNRIWKINLCLLEMFWVPKLFESWTPQNPSSCHGQEKFQPSAITYFLFHELFIARLWIIFIMNLTILNFVAG